MDTSIAGTYSGQMTLTSNDSLHSPLAISLSGTVSPPAPSISVLEGATTLNNGATAVFADTFVGIAGTKTFTIRNLGTAALTIESLQWPSGFSLISSPAGSVGPEGSTTFTLQFDATSAGTFSGQVSFTDNDAANGVFIINIAGL